MVINNRFVDKVLFDVGLFISIFNIDKHSKAFVLPGKGSYFSEIYFTAVIFRPFLGQIIDGTVKTIDQSCIQSSIPLIYIQFRDSSRNVWIWVYQTDLKQDHLLYISEGDKIRFRVLKLQFKDLKINENAESPEETP
ncbi:hypothetical protein MXB_882, partial [Myxobolus squamalis]